MNARQAKKLAKKCFYLGVADAFYQQVEAMAAQGIPLQAAQFTLQPIQVGLGHNQHGYSSFVKMGKHLLKLARK